MIHALTLLAIVVFAAPLARFIPLSVLAAILLVVSYNMGEWGKIPELLKLSRMEIATWLVTFLLTLFADLTVAVEAGMILAVLVFIQKVTQTTTVSELTEEYAREGHVHILQHKVIPTYAAIFRIDGPFLFGATDKIDEITTRLPSLPPVRILRLRNMTAIDSTGLQALESLADQVHESGRELILCGVREQPSRLMHQAEFQQHIGPENKCNSIAEALNRARAVYSEASKHHPNGNYLGPKKHGCPGTGAQIGGARTVRYLQRNHPMKLSCLEGKLKSYGCRDRRHRTTACSIRSRVLSWSVNSLDLCSRIVEFRGTMLWGST